MYLIYNIVWVSGVEHTNSVIWTCIFVLSHFSRVQLFATLWTAAHQAPLPMGFSRQEYWRGLPCPPPGDLPDPGIELASPASPSLQADSLPLSHGGSRRMCVGCIYIYISFQILFPYRLYIILSIVPCAMQ